MAFGDIANCFELDIRFFVFFFFANQKDGVKVVRLCGRVSTGFICVCITAYNGPSDNDSQFAGRSCRYTVYIFIHYIYPLS